MATIRNLKIKTATCKRIVKELDSYEKEVEREAAKTADMKEKGADPYDLKQQVCINSFLLLFFIFLLLRVLLLYKKVLLKPLVKINSRNDLFRVGMQV